MSMVLNGDQGPCGPYDYQTPATGFSYTLTAPTTVFAPAATLATGTVVMPTSPTDGMVVTISSTQIITALTLSANTGQSILSALSAFTVGGYARYLYRSANTTWYRIG
jgi:hypothetical protein